MTQQKSRLAQIIATAANILKTFYIICVTSRILSKYN